MAENTNWWDENGDDLLGAAIAYWQQRQNSKTPNTYNVPLSPSEQWEFDQKKKLFDNSPMRNYVYGFGDQFLRGMSDLTPKTFQFQSPDLQASGQTFAGGIQGPKFDFSKIGTPWDAKPPSGVVGGSPTTPTAPVGEGQLPRGGYGTVARPNNFGPRNRTEADFPGSGPQHGEEIGSYLGRNPGATPGDNLPNGGRGSVVREPDWSAAPTPGVGSVVGGLPQGDIKQAWTDASSAVSQFKQTHPNWASMSRQALTAAAGAVFGPLGALVMRIAMSILFRGNNGPTSSPGGNGTPITLPGNQEL
jgi:hypothetical protein